MEDTWAPAEAGGERGAPGWRGDGAAARRGGRVQSLHTRPREELAGGKGAGSAGTQHWPCHAAACPIAGSPSPPRHLYPTRILSWQRMGNDESSSPQPHPARPKESSAPFEVAFKGSQK